MQLLQRFAIAGRQYIAAQAQALAEFDEGGPKPFKCYAQAVGQLLGGMAVLAEPGPEESGNAQGDLDGSW